MPRRSPARAGRSAAGTAAPRRPPRILSCRLAVSLPHSLWMHRFTVAHPEARLEVVDRLEMGGGVTMLEVRVSAFEGGGWSEEVRSLPRVKDVELLSAAEGAETFRVYFRGHTFIPLMRRLGLVRHLPFPVQNGVATWTFTGPQTKVRALLRSLEKATQGVRVEALRHGPFVQGSSLLTPRQQEVLRRAMAEGYFDVPRRVSLTELAARLGIAISTLSVTLAVIEKKILEPHAGASPPARGVAR